jgi:hypothetical protein
MSFNRLNDMFESKGFLGSAYYTIEGYYRLAEVVNLNNAVSLVIYIDPKHRIKSCNSKYEYSLIPKEVASDALPGFVDEADLRSSYREIDHISKALEDEEKLQDIYDKPISLKGDESKTQEKFSGSIRQMKRFRLCVRNIPYKLCLFDNDCLCVLNDNSEIENYFIEGYKAGTRKLFITTSLDNFYHCSDIEVDVRKIQEQFYGILQSNQKIETSKIQSMIDAKKNVADQSRRIMGIKQNLFDKINSLQDKHSDTIIRKKQVQKLIKAHKPSEPAGALEALRQEMKELEDKRADLISTIITSRKELDELCLVVDNILFDNMLMLTKISNNFKLLERLKP